LHWRRSEFQAVVSRIEEAYGEDFRESDATDYFESWFLPVGGDSFRSCGKMDQARRWLNAGIAECQDSQLAFNLRATFNFEMGSFSDAINDLEAALRIDGSALWTHQRIGEMCALVGELDRAIKAFTAVLSARPDETNSLSQRAQVLFRYGASLAAEADVAQLLALNPSDPWCRYLEGLGYAFKGDRETFAIKVAEALEDSSAKDDITLEYKLTRAIYSLALGRTEHSLVLDDVELLAKAIEHVRYRLLAQLDCLVEALPEKEEIRCIREAVFRVAWPRGATNESSLIRSQLEALPRSAYLFPTYCQLRHIPGLERDGEIARKVLETYRSGGRAIVLWTVDRPDRVYGEANFALDGSSYSLKFCESVDTLLRSKLEVFKPSIGLLELLFVESELMTRFQAIILQHKLAVSCVLVRPPAEL